MQDPEQILTRYWGYTAFRPLQEDIINSVLAGKDTIALLPTGGGKSICFQVPALAKDGLCLVVSPLIALMKDQVENLKSRGIKATCVVSGMNKREIDIALDNCAHSNMKFLYVSPERLTTEIFRARVQKMNVRLIAVDEAHCISQWGYDFRPPYLRIAELRELLPEVPVIALTATATSEVVTDIQNKLAFKEKNLFQKSFERKNVAYVVLQEEDKLGRLLKVLHGVQGSAIVYVRNRRKTKDTAQFLNHHNISADYYHAGLPHGQRDEKQTNWITGKTRVIVATNAFGMGIDKPDVRSVIHLDLPDSLEAYFQEAGRAGRDEKKAYAVLLYQTADKLDLEARHKTAYPAISDIKAAYQALCNYLQLAVGTGQDEVFELDVADLSKRFELSAVTVYNALKILELDGYFSLSEAMHRPSQVKFLLNHADVYAFEIANKKLEPIIKLLLRSYSGLFDSHTKVFESEMAKRANTTTEVIHTALSRLQSMGVIEYLESSNKPMITFLQNRVAHEQLKISKAAYETRKNTAELRIEAMVTYASSEHKCRSQILLYYFGETDAYRCGICDVCLERNKLNLSNLEFEQVSNKVKAILKEEELPYKELVANLSGVKEKNALKVIEWLTDNGKIVLKDDNKLGWVK